MVVTAINMLGTDTVTCYENIFPIIEEENVQGSAEDSKGGTTNDKEISDTCDELPAGGDFHRVLGGKKTGKRLRRV
jgi:hypothetical protein